MARSSSALPLLLVLSVMAGKQQQSHDDDNGCGPIDDPTLAHWKRYTDDELHVHRHVNQCLNRMDVKTQMDLTPSQEQLLQALHCNDNKGSSHDHHSRYDDDDTAASTPFAIQTVWQRYRNVHLWGDSVLRQVFFTILCALSHHDAHNNTLTRADIHQIGRRGYQYGDYFHYILPNNNSNNSTTTTTNIYFHSIGFVGDPSHSKLKQAILPPLLKATSSDDAIVLHVGAHYPSRDAGHLQHALEFMSTSTKNQSETRASVFLVEPATTDWPTSNGQWTKACLFRCHCEAMNPDRMQGRGNLSGAVDYAMDSGKNGVPTESVFSMLYPGLASQWNLSSSECIPDCGPARWRVDLVRHVLGLKKSSQTGSASMHHNIRIVPVWWQLVGLQSPTPRRHGDCTHKSTQALLMMSQQLTRAMRAEQKSENEKVESSTIT